MKLFRRLTKRVFDFVVALIALVLLTPFFVCVAIAIKLESGDSVFYLADRVGRNGRPFKPFKFRTMAVGAEHMSQVVTTPVNDFRITRVGRILRRFNVDEWPQVINVLKGEMSIVGPRPEIPQWVALYTPAQRELLLSIPPGITDWATVWIGDKGKRVASESDPDKLYREEILPQKLALQAEYVTKSSVWTDILIILKTFKVHLFDRFRASQDVVEAQAPAVGGEPRSQA